MNNLGDTKHLDTLMQENANRNQFRQMIRNLREKYGQQKTLNEKNNSVPVKKNFWRSVDNVRNESADASMMNASIDYDNRHEFSRRRTRPDKLPMVLFSTGGEEKRPGPADYTISNGDIQDKMKKGFGATIKGRHQIGQSFEKTPGPAAYDLMKAKPRYIKNAFTIARASREGSVDSKERNKIPGPLDYKPGMTFRIKGTIPFGNTQAPKATNDNPGPGQYQANYQLRRIPKFMFNQSKLNRSVDDVKDGAGPAGYRPNINAVKSNKPSAHIGTSKRTDPNQSSCSPGVGKYRPEAFKPKHSGSIVFSAEKRFKSNLQVCLK